MVQKQNRLYPLDRIRNISADRLGTLQSCQWRSSDIFLNQFEQRRE